MNDAKVHDREVLPPAVTPKDYRLFLRVYLDECRFDGDVTITVDVTDPLTEITLNALGLELTRAQVFQDGVTRDADVSYDPSKGRATLAFMDALAPGEALIRLKYSGELNDSLVGFYKSTYEQGGVKKIMAVSQMEAAHARRVLPCFDQPDMKAVFRITMEVPTGCVAISNAETDGMFVDTTSGRTVVPFKPTPKMSTYLLAFVVGELEKIEKTAADGTVLRVWATPGKAEQGRFALDMTERALAYFRDYFGVPYALPKLDQIAVPDFAAGAMENWGAIIYRDNLLLVSEDSSRGTKQAVAETVAHELSHQWFGNLVTMEWWEDLWLNEGFATWIGAKVTNHLFPEFDLWSQFVNKECGSGMKLDGLESTHPIHVHVPTAESIDEIFDAISYNKGGSVLRMLEAYLGADTVRAGLRLYMQRHAYGNTIATDLWDALEEASDKPVGDIMHDWTHEPGYPVVKVHAGRAASDEGVPFVTQRRFRYGDASGASTDGFCWRIPLVMRTDLGQHETLVTGESETIMDAKHATVGASFLCMNADRVGFYRVHYDQDSLKGILAAVATKQLTTNERLGVEDDAFALCRAGVIGATEYLEIAKAYAGETEYAVWANLLGHLGKLRQAFAGDREIAEALNGFCRGLVAGIVVQVGWDGSEDEPHSQTLLRSRVLRFAGDSGDRKVIEEAGSLFEEIEESDREAVLSDLRDVVYALAVADGDVARFRSLWRLYLTAESSEEQSRILQALGSAGSMMLRGEALLHSMSDDVRPQDTPRVLSAVARSASGDKLAWNFVRDRWDAFSKRYDGNSQLLGYCVKHAVESLFDARSVAEARKFFAEKKPAGLERTIAQALETAESNVAFRERNLEALLLCSQPTVRPPAMAEADATEVAAPAEVETVG